MGAVAFDTLKFAQTLRDKGHVPQDQAEGIAEAFAGALADEMVTKTYFDSRLQVFGADIDSRFQAMNANIDSRLQAMNADIDKGLRANRADFETRLESTKAEILKWMFGTIGFQTVVILGAVFALSRFGR